MSPFGACPTFNESPTFDDSKQGQITGQIYFGNCLNEMYNTSVFSVRFGFGFGGYLLKTETEVQNRKPKIGFSASLFGHLFCCPYYDFDAFVLRHTSKSLEARLKEPKQKTAFYFC